APLERAHELVAAAGVAAGARHRIAGIRLPAQHDEGAGEHDDEADDAEPPELARDADDGEGDARDDDECAEGDSRGVDATPTGRGKLRVTPIEVPLHLIEQSVLVLGEGHAPMIRRGAGRGRASQQDRRPAPRPKLVPWHPASTCPTWCRTRSTH